MFNRARIIIFILGLLVIIGFTVVQSQDAQTCPSFVNTAMEQLDEYCGGMERNSACYGYFRVGATLAEGADTSSFSNPADQVSLTSLQTITTAPYDPATEQWGIAVMNVQANVPNSLPGQAVQFILMGDTQVTNAVAAEDVLTPTDPIMVTTVVEANLRSSPTLNANIMAIVDYNTMLEADGISPDGEWLRVLHLSANMWVHLSTVAPIDVSSLPVIDEETRTPMQAFYFTTGLGNPQCMDAPDMLLVQGPNEVMVDLTVNGVDIAVGSTIAFRNMHGRAQDLFTEEEIHERMGDIDMDTACQLMKVSVVSGAIELNSGGMLLPEGHTASSVMCDEQDDNEPPTMMDWKNPEPMNEDDRAQLGAAEHVPPTMMNYEIEIPSDEDVANGPKPEILPVDEDEDGDNLRECNPERGDDMGDPDKDDIPNVCDNDDDNDGLLDIVDMCPLRPGLRLNRGCPDEPISVVPIEIRECIAKLPRDIATQCVHDTNRDGVLDSISCPDEWLARLKEYCGGGDDDTTCEYKDKFGDPCNHDEDDDGIRDSIDVCPFDAYHDEIGDPCNHDEDKDGIDDGRDECPYDVVHTRDCQDDDRVCIPQRGDDIGDPDKDGIPNVCDDDDDGDGIIDGRDECPLDPYHDEVGDPCNHDEDDDGIGDSRDECPLDPKNECATDACVPQRGDDVGDPDGDGIPNVCDEDDDGDGIVDSRDQCPLDPKNECENECVPQRGDDIGDPDGDGIPNVCDDDDDGDGIVDSRDQCPLDPRHDDVGDPCNHDEDDDGIIDPNDECPLDPKNECDVVDSDGDGIADPDDVCPNDPVHDNVGDPCNHDEDKDGITDNQDACPYDSYHDKVGDPCNHDEDKDGIADEQDVCPYDSVHDNVGNACDHDEDDDGITDNQDVCPYDRIHDNVGNPCVHDEDHDGIADESDVCPFDAVHDKVGDPCNHDEDRDGIGDESDVCPYDAYHDKVGDPCNHDEDRDGVGDDQDACPSQGASQWGLLSNGCPAPPPDSDRDGVADPNDKCPSQGSVGYGVYPDGCPILDSDGDGTPDPDDKCPADPNNKC